MSDHYYADWFRDIVDRFWSAIQNNTNGFAFFVNQSVIMLMLFEVIHWTEPQMFGFLSFVAAGLAFVVGKTTMASVKVDQRVEERIAHREMTGQSGTGTFKAPAGTGGTGQ